MDTMTATELLQQCQLDAIPADNGSGVEFAAVLRLPGGPLSESELLAAISAWRNRLAELAS